jgi:hypothetical protein
VRVVNIQKKKLNDIGRHTVTFGRDQLGETVSNFCECWQGAENNCDTAANRLLANCSVEMSTVLIDRLDAVKKPGHWDGNNDAKGDSRLHLPAQAPDRSLSPW